MVARATSRSSETETPSTDAEGRETWTLTPQGVQVANQVAIGDEATFDAILDAVEGRT